MSLPHGCRVPRIWAIPCCSPRPQAGTGREVEHQDRNHCPQGFWCIQSEDLATRPSHWVQNGGCLAQFAKEHHQSRAQLLDSGRVQPHGGEPHHHWQNKSNAEAAISMRILLSIREWATESLEAPKTLRASQTFWNSFYRAKS